VARRQVDNQPPDLALVHRRQLGGDDPGHASLSQTSTWGELAEVARREAPKTPLEDPTWKSPGTVITTHPPIGRVSGSTSQ
jgi:hypothetical protein